MQRSSFAAVGCQRARYLGVACTSLSNLLRPAESAADIKLSWWQGMLGQQELNTPVVAQWSTHLPARWKTEARAPAIANAVSCPRQHNGYHCRFQKPFSIRGSIVVSISACHAEDLGSIPGRGGVNTAPLAIEQIQRSALGLQWQAGYPPGLFTMML